MLAEEKRIEALELAHTLYQLAADLEMKLRILDSIRECEAALEKDMPENEWIRVEQQLNEIIGYMEKEILGEEAVLVNDDVIVSKEDIRKRIMELWNRGRESGIEGVSAYQTNSLHILQKIKNDMNDLANADANYHIVSVPERFEGKCIQMSQFYGQEMNTLSFDYLNFACEQYAQAMERIKGVIVSIDRRQVAITARDIYEKWDSRQELCKQNLKAAITGTDNGKQLLAQFGQEQVEPLRRIQKKNQKRRRFLMVLPILLILVLVLGGILISTVPKIISAVQESKTTEAEDNSLAGIVSGLSEAAKSLSDVEPSGASSGELMIFIIPLIIILFIVAYFLWGVYIGRRYRSWMVDETGTYLGPKIEEFWQKDGLKTAKEAYFREISQSVMRCYEELFQDVFGDTFTDEENLPSETIKNARVKWKRIRNMR